MKYFDWSSSKNEKLQQERNISFEEIVIAIDDGGLLDVVHTDKKKYPNQQLYIVQIEEYAYIVPFVEDEEKIFLKTIIPSRKATKQYIITTKK